MTAKQYLMQAFRMKKKIESMQEDILRLEAAATDCSPNLTGMPHNPSPSHSRMADIVCKIIDRKAELEKKMYELEALGMEIGYRISLLDSADYRQILQLRYIDGSEWSEIADTMGYCESWVFKNHRKALAAFQKTLKEYS